MTITEGPIVSAASVDGQSAPMESPAMGRCRSNGVGVTSIYRAGR